MTVVMHDPLYPTRLPSKSETLDFTVTGTDPDEITVSMLTPDGHVETIFQAGLVGEREYIVTRDGEADRTFHIQRKAGWPEGRFKVPILEAPAPPAPPTGGQPWGAIYELDFTAQPSQTLGAPGAYTIDGLTWWRKNDLKSGNVIQIVNGSGLQISDPSGMLGGVDAPRLCLPVASVPGFNPNSPYQVWGHWTGDSSGGFEFTLGLIDAASDATAITSGHEATHMGLGPSRSGASSVDWFLTRNAINSNFDGPTIAASYTDAEAGIMAATTSFDCAMLSAGYAGTLPSADPFSYGVWHTFGHSVRANAMAIFTPFWRANVVVKKLVVVQPAVP